MTATEIKKELYRQKPTASLRYIRNGVAHYHAELSQGSIEFEVPVSDMGGADFMPSMDAKLLNRWLATAIR